MDRREFLKGTLTLTAGVVATVLLPSALVKKLPIPTLVSSTPLIHTANFAKLLEPGIRKMYFNTSDTTFEAAMKDIADYTHN